jgi:ADP-heptose:LPS heptosyltransferase
MPRDNPGRTVLVHLASGVGNIVMATPLLAALDEMGFTVDVRLDADYAQTADLLADWHVVRRVLTSADLRHYDAVVPAIPPFYWRRFGTAYRALATAVPRPPDGLFYSDEQAYYFAFARALGCRRAERTAYRLPIGPSDRFDVGAATLVIAPGCKTGEMAAKRWPYFPELAERFDDVAIAGTPDDLTRADGTAMAFPGHVRSFIGRLSLRDTAELLASAAVVAANDSGLGHIAGAVGAPTVMLFGPTPDRALGWLPANVSIVRSGLPCEPCWQTARLRACRRSIDCLAALDVDRVERLVRARLTDPLGIGPQEGGACRTIPSR